MSFLLPIIMALTINSTSSSTRTEPPPPAPPTSVIEVAQDESADPGQCTNSTCSYDEAGNVIFCSCQ